jgi:hypothetical protein
MHYEVTLIITSTYSNSSSILKKQESRLLNLGIFWGNFLLAYSCVEML